MLPYIDAPTAGRMLAAADRLNQAIRGANDAAPLGECWDVNEANNELTRLLRELPGTYAHAEKVRGRIEQLAAEDGTPAPF